MIEVVGAGLENVVYFESAHVKLNENALTFVRGVNLDSDPASPTGNGAGKSLFFSILPTIAYASPPTSTKKKAKKEVLSKASKMFVQLKAPNGSLYEIEQGVSKYKIEKDGVDTLIRTVPLAEAEIRNTIFPLSEIEYYSHGYVSTLRPYKMLCSEDSDRLEHLSTIFKLEDYAQMRAFFATKLRSVKDNEVRVSVLEQKQITLSEKLARVSKLVSPEKIVKHRKEHKSLEREIGELVEQEFNELKTKQLLATLRTIETELDELRFSYKSKQAPKDYLAWLKSQKSLVKKMGEFTQLNKAYKRNTQSIQEKIEALQEPSKSVEKLTKEKKKNEKLLEELNGLLEKLQEQERAYKSVHKKLAPLLEQYKEFGDEVKDVEQKADYASDIASLKLSLKLQTLLDHDHLEGNACPTCMSEVDIDNIRTVVNKAKKRLPALKQKFEIQQLVVKIKSLREESKSVVYNKGKHDETAMNVSLIEGAIEEGDMHLRIWKKLADLKETLSEIRAPKRPSEEPETELSYSELDAQMDQCNAILQHVNARSKLLENNPDIADCRTVKAVKIRLTEVESRLGILTEQLRTKRTRSGELSGLIEKQNNIKSENDLYETELREVQAEIIKVKPASDDKKILETLIKAYSTKGLKTIVANRICALLEANLNLYRPLIFVEPFTFTAHASETGLSIKVDRGNGKVSDVRNLSGAESDCFILLHMLSLLPLIPDNRRLSMVILDEPTAHCDAVTRRLFLESYLPALCEVVPHVYVITNEPDDHIVGSHEWVIVKKRGVATLVTPQTVNNAHNDEPSTAKNAAKKSKKVKSTKRGK